ncbi:MAG: metallophosphoesterase family protein [Planctomycetes bacterium]|nr:metallophosphoesterase family protein [Planctomycetota bacterium]
MRLAFFGGIYSNHLALAAAIADARSRGVDAMWCLGDLGGFGPHPDRTCELIRNNNVSVVQGNYDHSIGHGLNDCQCGYTDPRDNHFAQLSYDYTLTHNCDDHRTWMRTLPAQQRVEFDGVRLLLCHGSPRRTNEFLWDSTTSTQFLAKMCDNNACDVILGTHTGLHWQRTWDERGAVSTKSRGFINVGVLGRPENDGTINVWYTLLRTGGDVGAGEAPLPWEVEFVPLIYDHERLACEMRDERLPDEFIQTILTGWWTTCLEVLPSKERRRGQW